MPQNKTNGPHSRILDRITKATARQKEILPMGFSTAQEYTQRGNKNNNKFQSLDKTIRHR
jgi:hypothetical protein